MGTKRAPVLERPFLNVRDAAAYLGLTPRQLRRWIESRTLPIPITKISGRNYFRPDDLDRLAAGFEVVQPSISLDAQSMPRDESGRFVRSTKGRTR